MFVHRICQVLDPRHDLVLVGKDVVKHRRTVTADRSRTCRHGKGHACFRALCMIGGVAFFRHAILRIGWFVAGRHNAVSQCEVFELKRLQEWVAGHFISFLSVLS